MRKLSSTLSIFMFFYFLVAISTVQATTIDGMYVNNIISGQYNVSWNRNSKGIKISTKIPVSNQDTHTVIIEGKHTGGLSPIRVMVTWRSHGGSFTNLSASVMESIGHRSISLVASPIIKLNNENGTVAIYIEHNSPNYFWYYALDVDSHYGGSKPQMNPVWYQGWTLTRLLTTAPSRATIVPIGTTLRGQVFVSDKVGIGIQNPNSSLQVAGYIQLGLTSGAPPAIDCKAASDHGRMKVDNVFGLLYICANSGWIAK